jgi:hypothetical protein
MPGLSLVGCGRQPLLTTARPDVVHEDRRNALAHGRLIEDTRARARIVELHDRCSGPSEQLHQACGRPRTSVVVGAWSPDALSVVRNLPTSAARAELDPVVAVAQAGLDLQEDLEHAGLGRGGELALRQVAAGLRIERIKPHTVVDEWLAVGLGPTRALRLPESVPEIAPWDRTPASAWTIRQPSAWLKALSGPFFLRPKGLKVVFIAASPFVSWLPSWRPHRCP